MRAFRSFEKVYNERGPLSINTVFWAFDPIFCKYNRKTT
jgi:hypothetical protein